MEKTISTTLGEVIIVEKELNKKDSGYRWNVKWIPAELQFVEQQVIGSDDAIKKQRFLFLAVAVPVEGTTKIQFVLQSDGKLEDTKETEDVKVVWNTDVTFVSYNPNVQNQFSQDAMMKYGYPCATAGDPNLPFIRRSNPYMSQSTANDGFPILAYGYPCVAQTAMPYGMAYEQETMKYGYPCMTQTVMPYGMAADNTAMIYGYPVDAGMKYGYACAAQASMPYGYGFPNYDGK